jgi:hypothetical protein
MAFEWLPSQRTDRAVALFAGSLLFFIPTVMALRQQTSQNREAPAVCVDTYNDLETDVLKSLSTANQAMISGLPCAARHRMLKAAGDIPPGMRDEMVAGLFDISQRLSRP